MKFLFYILFISACMPTFIGHQSERDYTSTPLIGLPAGKLFITSNSDNTNELSLAVNKKLKNWALIRLRPNYSGTNTATFNIKKADILVLDIPKKYFWELKHEKYILSFGVELFIRNKDIEIFKAVSWGEITKTFPVSSSPLEKENFLDQMIREMENEIEKKFSTRIQDI